MRMSMSMSMSPNRGNIYWPKSEAGLPPGQGLLAELPRFGANPFRPPPGLPSAPSVAISLDRRPIAALTSKDLEGLGPAEFKSDMHCVTTWSVRNLQWTGIPLRAVVQTVGLAQVPANYLVARSWDGWRSTLVASDAMAPDVIIATHLGGRELGARHGGPMRLVTPGHYAYKSVKHLQELAFRTEEPRRSRLEHFRGRVRLEERHPTLPNWLIRPSYRLLITPIAYIADRGLRSPASEDTR